MSRQSNNTTALLMQQNSESLLLQAYTALKINIDFVAKNRDVQTITVTSSKREEGRTTTCLNLGMVYAKAGKKVIMIDADFRNFSLHRPLEMNNLVGLSNWLSQYNQIEEIIQDTLIPNLFLITSGSIPANPPEVLSGNQMDVLLKYLKQHYDIILIDTPPIIGTIDAKILASKSDGAVLVLEYGKVKRNIAKKIKADLLNANANLLGVFLNKVKGKHIEPYAM